MRSRQTDAVPMTLISRLFAFLRCSRGATLSLLFVVITALVAAPGWGQKAEDDQPPVAGQQKPEEDEGDDNEGEEISHGLTEEEREFIARPVTELTPAEQKRRRDLIKKMQQNLRRDLEKNKETGAEPGEDDQGKDTPKQPVRRGGRVEVPNVNPPRTTPQRPSAADRRNPNKSAPKQPATSRNQPRTTPSTTPNQQPLVSGAISDAMILAPFDKRPYGFGLYNGTYQELVEFISRRSGLSLLDHVTPLDESFEGVINFTSPDDLSFHDALDQINDVLYSQVRPPLYLYLEEEPGKQPRLELYAIKELRSQLPEHRVFVTLAAVRDASLRGSDIIRVFFLPESASDMEVFNKLVSMVKDDHTLASLDDSGYIDYYGRVDELEKMLEYLLKFKHLFTSEGQLERIALNHITPSDASVQISTMVENVVSEAVVAPRGGANRRGGNKDALTPESEYVIVIPDDAHNSLLVKGLAYKINEIRNILKAIDIPDEPVEVPSDPVVVVLENVQAEDAAELLNQVVNGQEGKGGAKAARKRAKPRGKTVAASAPAEDETLEIIPAPRSNALILQGPDELITFAREFIAEVIDLPAEDIRSFRRVPISNRDPVELQAVIKSMITGAQGRPKKGEDQFQIEVVGNSLVFVGDRSEMDQAAALISELDVPDVDAVTTFVVELERAEPSFVIEILQSFDTTKAEGGGKGKARRGGGNRFFADDVAGMIYFTGTQREWEGDILPMIQKIDSTAKRSEGTGRLVQLDHADAAEVIAVLTAIHPPARKGKEATGPTFVVAPQGLIVAGNVSPAMMTSIEDTIKVLDVDPDDFTEGTVTRQFELQHADPIEVRDAILALLATKVSTPRAKGAKRRQGSKATTDEGEALAVVVTDTGLIVDTIPDKFEEIEQIITMMDVPTSVETIVLERFAIHHADINELAIQLQPLLELKMAEVEGRDPSGKARKSDTKFNVQADGRTGSLLVSAPQKLIDYAADVLTELDVPLEEEHKQLTAIYDCVNASASELAGILVAVFGDATAPTPAPSAAKGPRARRGPGARPKVHTGDDVEIIALPGDQAINVIAYSQEILDKVLIQAEEIDMRSKSGEKETRKFRLMYADVDDVADWLIDMLDQPARGAPKTEEDDFWVQDTGPKIGKDMRVLPNYETRTLIVVAPPEKMVAAAALIQQFEDMANPNTEDGGGEVVVEPAPYDLLELQYVNAFDAVEKGDRILDKLLGFDRPVTIDFFTEDTMVIKGRRQLYQFVKDTIRKHVDTEDALVRRTKIDYFNIPAAMPPEQVFKFIQNNMDDVRIDIQDMPQPGENANGLVKEIVTQTP